VVIRFDERISERLTGVQRLSDAVLVSPETSPVRVDRRRRAIEVKLVRGWEPDRVYRVVIQPVFADLFNNRRQEPVDLVFSTGAPIPETAVGGFVHDGLTLEPVVDARIEALHRGDSTTYVGAADTAGFFALRYLPAGEYRVLAWRDQNRDRVPDFFEAQDSTPLTLAAPDTSLLELALLPGDTTPPVLGSAQPVDSLRIRLLFDDHFAPGDVAGMATVYDLTNDRFVAEVPLLHGARLDSLLAAEQAVADSLAALEAARAAIAQGDTLPPDTLPSDTARVVPPGVDAAAAPPETPAAPRAPGPPLPSRELIVVLPLPVIPGVLYRVEVAGVTNIQGVAGGGGTAQFEAPERQVPPAAEPPPDTLPGPVDP
jgi:hypothetical protein